MRIHGLNREILAKEKVFTRFDATDISNILEGSKGILAFGANFDRSVLEYQYRKIE